MKKRALFVDDESIVLDELRRILRAERHRKVLNSIRDAGGLAAGAGNGLVSASVTIAR